MRFEIYERPVHIKAGDQYYTTGKWSWYWRLRAGNGRIVADGAEAYDSKANVTRAINRLFGRIVESETSLEMDLCAYEVT